MNNAISIKLLMLIASIAAFTGCYNYTYTDLVPNEYSDSVALDINDNGEVAGICFKSADVFPMLRFDDHPYFFIYRNNKFNMLPDPCPSSTSEGEKTIKINNNGEIIGSCGGKNEGFIYRDGEYIFLESPEWHNIQPSDINDNGTIVGTGSGKGFLYGGGSYIELLPPGFSSVDYIRINNNGTVVGHGYYGKAFVNRIFIYNGETYTELLPPGWMGASAVDINDSGAVLGWGNDGTDTTKGFIYSDGTYTELLPPGYTYAAPSGINENGVVVGLGYYKSACQLYNRGEVFIASPK